MEKFPFEDPKITEGRLLFEKMAKSVAAEFADTTPETVMHLFALSEGEQVANLKEKDSSDLAKLFSPNELLDEVRWNWVREHLHRLKIEQEAATDPLTGLANRGAFDLELRRRSKQYGRDGKGFSLLMIDIDEFKSVNDEFEHPVGDAVLRAVAKITGDLVRPKDFPARYGGEELAIVVDGNEEIAKMLAERLREAIENMPVAELGIDPKTRPTVTASFGVCEYEPTEDVDIETATQELITRADKALYAAKQNGRNTVVVAGKKD